MTISGAVMQGGQALSPDGALYVKLDSGSSITGTTITATTAFYSLGNSPSVPTYSFTGATTTGISHDSGNGALVLFASNSAPVIVTSTQLRIGSTTSMGFSSAVSPTGAAADTFLTRYAAKQLMISGDGSTQDGTILSGLHSLAGTTESTVGIALTANKKVKSVTAIADNVATNTITVTVPNAAHSAMLKLTLKGSLGAGGAIGANEATGTISYDVAIARTAGVATVATFSAAYGSATASVAGAATITITAAASAMSGAVGATQTFTVQVTIAKGSGSSDNHTCQVLAEIINANATGVTLA